MFNSPNGLKFVHQTKISHLVVCLFDCQILTVKFGIFLVFVGDSNKINWAAQSPNSRSNIAAKPLLVGLEKRKKIDSLASDENHKEGRRT